MAHAPLAAVVVVVVAWVVRECSQVSSELAWPCWYLCHMLVQPMCGCVVSRRKSVLQLWSRAVGIGVAAAAES